MKVARNPAIRYRPGSTAIADTESLSRHRIRYTRLEFSLLSRRASSFPNAKSGPVAKRPYTTALFVSMLNDSFTGGEKRTTEINGGVKRVHDTKQNIAVLQVSKAIRIFM